MATPALSSAERLRQLIEAAKAKKLAASQDSIPQPASEASQATHQQSQQASQQQTQQQAFQVELQLPVAGNSAEQIAPQATFTPNQRQRLAMERALELESFCLIGAAGTGKTTVVRRIAAALSQHHAVPLLEEDTKVLRTNTPGIVCCSFTNIAVQNIARQMEGSVVCSTIHNLLEFAPVVIEEFDNATGNMKAKRIFEPKRNEMLPLPANLRVVIIEESGVVGTRLFQLLLDALPNPSSVTFIFLGDLHQLPPVFDNPILGRKLLELPIIELTEVYRQALDSPILALAHKVKDGCQMSADGVKNFIEEKNAGSTTSKVTIKHFKSKTSTDGALHIFHDAMEKMIMDGSYSPEDTMILIPYNVNFGTIEANKNIASVYDKKEGREVWEVIAGFNKHYFAVGDIIYSRKRKARITKIVNNGKYFGVKPIPPSKTLNRWGIDSSISIEEADSGYSLRDADSILAALESEEEIRKTAASHIITITFLDHNGDDAGEEEFDDAAGINEFIGGYCLTVHKAQGSEWENVICWFHNSHARFISREVLYTAITRAKKNLIIICEKDTFIRGVNNQALKGNTLAEKLESLKKKLQEEATNLSFSKKGGN